MYSALESLKSSEHLTISVSANEYVVSDAASIIREYASKGYNLIVAHGSQYGFHDRATGTPIPGRSPSRGELQERRSAQERFRVRGISNEGGYVQATWLR